MTSVVKFGIVGCGRIAFRHAKHISNLGKLVAACDVDENRAETLTDKYGGRAYGSYEEMLDACGEIDVISVCSPNGLHSEHSITALKRGFHVLCEKPMAISVQDCGEMIKAAEKANKRLFIVKQNRFNPAIAEVKRLVDEGKLGRILSVQLNCFWNRNFDYYRNSEWKGTKTLDGGTLYTQFSHFIDLLYWIVGDVKEVRAITGNFIHQDIIDFEDSGVVLLEFFSGTIGTVNYTVNSYEKNMEGSLTLFGEKGTVKVGGQYLNKLEYQNIENYTIGELSEGNPANEYGDYQGSMSNHNQVYENVISVLTDSGEIATNGFEGLKTVEIIDKIYRAAHVYSQTTSNRH
ncbi:Gfo/Idh/MocA family protein [Marinoscillum furvescens]|uniref:Putative dehydrogenase n=1 Tax=Marinoscillum furvescens DSM 4134 TaxID=1122208 RepID=A0A3D9L293_MARFU|nr:Gfo/Idh/MocA family oxidoreductase [Marinoscillum furvescens]RED96632.1 putative dehydrogenase [Marinoscillum furvescens DSM 4134]